MVINTGSLGQVKKMAVVRWGKAMDLLEVISSKFLNPAQLHYLLVLLRVNYSTGQNGERETENDKAKFRKQTPA